jgi:hypothetical protein
LGLTAVLSGLAFCGSQLYEEIENFEAPLSPSRAERVDPLSRAEDIELAEINFKN